MRCKANVRRSLLMYAFTALGRVFNYRCLVERASHSPICAFARRGIGLGDRIKIPAGFRSSRDLGGHVMGVGQFLSSNGRIS
jgi:hypothetical protein